MICTHLTSIRYSVMNVSIAEAPHCAYWGWGCERPADGELG